MSAAALFDAFTVLCVILAGPGAVLIFLWFLRDLRQIVAAAPPDAGEPPGAAPS